MVALTLSVNEGLDRCPDESTFRHLDRADGVAIIDKLEKLVMMVSNV